MFRSFPLRGCKVAQNQPKNYWKSLKRRMLGVSYCLSFHVWSQVSQMCFQDEIIAGKVYFEGKKMISNSRPQLSCQSNFSVISLPTRKKKLRRVKKNSSTMGTFLCPKIVFYFLFIVTVDCGIPLTRSKRISRGTS